MVMERVVGPMCLAFSEHWNASNDDGLMVLMFGVTRLLVILLVIYWEIIDTGKGFAFQKCHQ